MEGGRSDLEQMIAAAVQAGSLRAAAKRFPDAARGLNRCAEFNSQRASVLAGKVAGLVAASPRQL